jgi:hypothetical protein
MAACDPLHGAGERFSEGDPSPEATVEFRRAFARVWLDATSTPVRNSAHELGNFLLVRQPQMEGEGDPRDIDRTYRVLLRNFLTAAQRDLGIDPPEPEEPVGGTQQGA